MARAFVLPDLGEGLTEAEIVKVLVQEGDLVQEDAPLLEVETDKATVEIPSPLTGRVTQIHVQPGQTAPPPRLPPSRNLWHRWASRRPRCPSSSSGAPSSASRSRTSGGRSPSA